MALVQLFGQFAGHAVDRAPGLDSRFRGDGVVPALDKQMVPDLREFVGAIAQAPGDRAVHAQSSTAE